MSNEQRAEALDELKWMAVTDRNNEARMAQADYLAEYYAANPEQHPNYDGDEDE